MSCRAPQTSVAELRMKTLKRPKIQNCGIRNSRQLYFLLSSGPRTTVTKRRLFIYFSSGPTVARAGSDSFEDALTPSPIETPGPLPHPGVLLYVLQARYHTVVFRLTGPQLQRIKLHVR